jgi:hypothetical protein
MQGNVIAALEFTDTGRNNSCGVLVDGVTVRNVRDGAIAIGGPNTTIRNCTFDRANMLTGDAAAITIQGTAQYSFTNINVLIERNTFTNMVRHPRQHQSHGAVFTIYDESSTYWTIQDNSFTNCDQAINVACGKNQFIRRNKFSNCHLGHYAAPIVFGSRVNYADNARAIPADLAAMNVQNEPYASAAPRLQHFLAGQPEAVVLLYHDDIECVDNMSNGGARLVRITIGSTWSVVNGFQVGVDPTQRNYPIGASGTPVAGGGTVPLGDLD